MKKVQSRKFKLKVLEGVMLPEDRIAIMNMHNHIKDLHSKCKHLPKDSPALGLLSTEIQTTREKVFSQYAHKYYKVTVGLGPHKEEEFFPYYPEKDNIVGLKDKLVNRLRKNKQEAKTMNIEQREFNGMRYPMLAPRNKSMGGVLFGPKVKGDVKEVVKPMAKFGGGRAFEKPGTILGLLKGPEYAQRVKRAKRPHDKKAHYVGVEIELICKVDRERLDELFVAARLAGNVYVKTDSSIRPEKDTDLCHEITLIAKQDQIEDVVTRVCAVLNSKEVSSYVNNSCGLHVHMDMRSRESKVCYHNFYQALPILVSMIPFERTNNQYCIQNITSDLDAAIQNGRRQAINAQALQSHNTIELRLHSGSTNALKINNWIKILCKVADKKEKAAVRAAVPMDLANLFGIDLDVVSYVEQRIEKFKNKDINTKADHLEMTA